MDFTELLKVFDEGDIVLSKSKRRFRNFLIPGKWSHACVLDGNGLRVIEVTPPEARYSSVENIANGSIRILVIRPSLSMNTRRKATSLMRHYLGSEYDFRFRVGGKYAYCSEAVAIAYNQASKREFFKYRRRFFRDTITPSDLLLADCRIVWESV